MTEITVETIYAIIEEREKRFNERFHSQEQAVASALTAAKEAVDKAEKAQERRLDLLNEFRAQAADESAKFLPKGEYNVNHEGLIERVNKLEVSVGRVQAGSGLIAAAIVAIAVKLFLGG